MNGTNLTIYGDSIMKGVVLEAGRYKIGSKIEMFAEKLFHSVQNRARFGSTIEKGVAMLENDVKRQSLPEGVVLLEFGGNDCDFDWAAIAQHPELEHEPKTTIDRFVALYRRAIETVRQSGNIPVIANLPPISACRYLTWICRTGLPRENILCWLREEYAIYRYQERYSLAIDELAEEEHIGLIDLRSAFLMQRGLDAYLCDDGIHPNAAGQELIIHVFEDYFAAHKFV